MVGAALSAATPLAPRCRAPDDRLPSRCRVLAKKAEKGRDLVANALRGLTGNHSRWCSSSATRSRRRPAAATLDQDELLERLKAEFKAEEVFDDDEGS